LLNEAPGTEVERRWWSPGRSQRAHSSSISTEATSSDVILSTYKAVGPFKTSWRSPCSEGATDVTTLALLGV